jgi:hypothetical protein
LLEAASIGLQYQREQIDQKITELRRRLGTEPGARPTAASAGAAPITKKRKMSPAARRRIALAQKERWAAWEAEHAAKQAPAAKTDSKKRVMSAAGRARIAAASKKRWAAYRKEQRVRQG